MSVRKSSHGTIFLIVSSGSPRALIASSLRSTSKKPFCPITRPLHPPMTAHGHRVRFVATWREEFLEVPSSESPTHGEQEMSVWNGHYACTCYHPLFVFNQFGDLERCALCPGGCLPTRSSKTGSVICSSVRWGDLQTRCAGSMPISAIRPEPGPSRAGLSLRSSGIPESFILVSASSSPT